MLQVRRYMPYGSGSRECLGMPQARVTMLATLAVMLSRFSFRLADQVSHLAFRSAQNSPHAHRAGMQSMITQCVIMINRLDTRASSSADCLAGPSSE